MNRRDFLQLMPGLAALPLVGRLFREPDNGSISLGQWQQFRETFVGDEPLYNPPVVDTSKMVKDTWPDDESLIIEYWDGEVTTRRCLVCGQTAKYRRNAAGEWELTE